MAEFRAAIRKKLLANQWSFLLIVVMVLSIVAGSVNARYWWMGNLSNLLGQISVLSLVACGATILIISGNFDISVGANIGLSSVVMAMLMRNGVFPPLAAFIGVLVSIVCAFLDWGRIDIISGAFVYYFAGRDWGLPGYSLICHAGYNSDDLWTV